MLAVDPGKTTGLCIVVKTEHTQEVRTWQLEQFETCRFIESSIRTYSNLVVVMERFTISPRTLQSSRDHSAIEIIGTARYLLKKNGRDEMVMQNPDQVMALMTDDRLRGLGIAPQKRTDNHAYDACRHAAYYLAQNRLIKL